MRLARAPTSRCPHCGRDSKTVQGVCADCWGSKGGHLLGARRRPPRLPVSPDALGVALALLVPLGFVLLWIWG